MYVHNYIVIINYIIYTSTCLPPQNYLLEKKKSWENLCRPRLAGHYFQVVVKDPVALECPIKLEVQELKIATKHADSKKKQTL